MKRYQNDGNDFKSVKVLSQLSEERRSAKCSLIGEYIFLGDFDENKNVITSVDKY